MAANLFKAVVYSLLNYWINATKLKHFSCVLWSQLWTEIPKSEISQINGLLTSDDDYRERSVNQ